MANPSWLLKPPAGIKTRSPLDPPPFAASTAEDENRNCGKMLVVDRGKKETRKLGAEEEVGDPDGGQMEGSTGKIVGRPGGFGG